MNTKPSLLRGYSPHGIRWIFSPCQQKLPALLIAGVAVISQISAFGAVNSYGECSVIVVVTDETGIIGQGGVVTCFYS